MAFRAHYGALAEQALLGTLLANNRAYWRVSKFLAPEHFADPLHGRIYQAIGQRIRATQIADAVTLKTEFEKDGALAEVGGVAYFAQLLSAMVGSEAVWIYATFIRDRWQRHQPLNGTGSAHPTIPGIVHPPIGTPPRMRLHDIGATVLEVPPSAAIPGLAARIIQLWAELHEADGDMATDLAEMLLGMEIRRIP